MTANTQSRGGARPGAGRPSAGTISKLLRLHRSTVKRLAQLIKRLDVADRHGAMSQFADQAITEKIDREPNWKPTSRTGN